MKWKKKFEDTRGVIRSRKDFIKSSMTGATGGARTAYPSRTPEFILFFGGVCVARPLFSA
jgi:hypothetical protein